MAKARSTKPRKRGPKEERLAQLPHDKLTERLKAEFDAADVEGKQALKDRDFASLDHAIKRERAVIERQKARVKRIAPPKRDK
jgi:hypothetical protein